MKDPLRLTFWRRVWRINPADPPDLPTSVPHTDASPAVPGCTGCTLPLLLCSSLFLAVQLPASLHLAHLLAHELFFLNCMLAVKTE